MKHDGTIDLATGLSRKTRKWKNKKWKWSEIHERLSQEHKTTETHLEYMSAPRSEQSDIKDVGGYVGGYLRNGKRSPKNVAHRQLMTLDIDFAHIHFWDDYLVMFDNAAVLHSTHKHHSKSPRFRLILPMSRECSADEYVAVSRKIAGDLGIELFDSTTFEPNRLMYWPSSPSDVEHYFRSQDGPWVDVDEVLDSYIDWKDTSLWPTSTAQMDRVRNTVKKQQDPETKKGIIGIFCRAYDIEEVIDTFLPDDYKAAGAGRYTYTKGSTAGGLIVYDRKFAFSHHGTDPSGGQLCNAFDLVRIHMFGHLDEDSQASGGATPSFKAMQQFALNDDRTKTVLASENLSQAKYDFAEEQDFETEDVDWMKGLEIDSKGSYKPSAVNLNQIFNNDPRLSGLFKLNEFDGKRYVFANLPWRRTTPPEIMRNVDYSGVRNYIESMYGISGSLKIDDVLALKFEEHSFHPIREYVRGLTWDGIPRLDNLFIDYFGATDSIYTKEAARKMMVGAIARIFVPGVKFDMVITFVGKEGTGKSTFANKIGMQWYSDTFTTVHGKEAFEQIQGAWVMELAELSGLRKAEVESVKHFLTKQVDSFRPAYARVSESFPRQCIFIGTTNSADFLKSTTGNRRFIPIDVNVEAVTKSVWDDLGAHDVGQLWAEAFKLYRKGEKLYMSKEADAMAKEEQASHIEQDERAGIVGDYLKQLLPKDWDKRSPIERTLFLGSEKDTGERIRDFVCAAEIWCECFEREKKDMDRYRTREINDIMKTMRGWEFVNSTKNFPHYGKQRYYRRV